MQVPMDKNTKLSAKSSVSIFAAVDQSFSDAVAKAIGLPCAKPLKVKPASEAIRFRPNNGLEQE